MALHSSTPEFILQEVCARLVVFHFDSLLMQSVEPREVRSKYKQQFNRAAGVTLCCALIRGKVTPQVFEALLMKMLLPIRKIMPPILEDVVQNSFHLAVARLEFARPCRSTNLM